LKLKGNARMLFRPERNERLGNPDPKGRQPVNPGMAGGAEGDQQLKVVHAGFPVMNCQKADLPTSSAGPAVTNEDLLA
jgi:hypothetical protein